MKKQRKAFTMIELIFVIVVIGILAMIALPKISGTIEDANIGKARSDVAALRSAIASERQARFLQGSSGYISSLDGNAAAAPGDGAVIFDDNDSNASNGKLLSYGVITGSGEGKWKKVAQNQYTFKSGDGIATFDYNNTTGIFTCTAGVDVNGTLCGRIIN